MTIYSLDVLLFLFGTSLLFHVQFYLLLPDLHTNFSRGRSGGLVFPSPSEFSTVYCDPHSQRLWHSQESRNRCFSCFFHDPADVGNLMSGFSAFSKTSLNIWKFTVHMLLKPGLENFEHYFTSVWDEYNCAVVWAFFGKIPWIVRDKCLYTRLKKGGWFRASKGKYVSHWKEGSIEFFILMSAEFGLPW